MSVTSALARETPVTAKMIATGSWKALKSKPGAGALGEACERADVHDEEEHRDDERRDDGLRLARDARGWRGRRPRRGRRGSPPCGPGSSRRWPVDGASVGHDGRRVIVSPSSWMRLPVSSRNTSSSVGVRSVRSRTRDAALVERDRHRADRRPAPSVGGDRRSRRRGRSTSLDAGHRPQRVGRASASPSTSDDDHVGADRRASARRACPRPRCGPRSMMPTRSASSSASSRYCVVRKIVMPSSLVEPAHLVPHRWPG